MLGDIAGQQVLEIGAAPGGKTAQLCHAGANVTALDRSQSRAERLQLNMQRLRFNLQIIIADILQFQPPQSYDIVVLDAPCSASGTWRRHPEVVYLIAPDDIAELAALQAQILDHVWPHLRVGGVLLYIVCSLEPEEGEQQYLQFLQKHPDARIRPATASDLLPSEALHADGYLRTNPVIMAEIGGMDGFFAVMLEKIA
jgi:16S rRNA (cytosine967-C5)-methyltransferase